MSLGKCRPILIVLLILAVLDALVAWTAAATLPGWRETFPDNAHRIRSASHHHDIAPMREIVEAWGPVRYRYASNALGFKDARPRSIDLGRREKRWLLLGVSFTEGIGFDFATSMAGRIAAGVACHGIEVLNGGVGGYAPSVYWRKARHLIETVGLGVERVIVFLDISDIKDETDIYFEDAKGDLIAPEAETPSWSVRIGHALRDHSVAARLFTLARDRLAYVRKDLIRRHQAAQAFGKGFWQVEAVDLMEFATVPHKASRWTYDEAAWADYGEKGRAKAAANMDELAELLARHGILLSVVVYPWPDQMFRDPQAPRHQGFWRDWAARRGAGFVSLFPAFTADPPRVTLASDFIPGDFHWNASGHQRAAQAFLEGYAPELAPCAEAKPAGGP